MHAWHVTLATESRMPMFADERARRTAIRRLAEIDHRESALFCIVHDHLHDLILGSRALAGRVVQAMALTLRPLVSAPLAGANVRPVESRRHAERLPRYFLDQPRHHDLGVDPALWSGSCFADLVGARRIEGMTLATAAVRPRFRPSDALGLVGLPRRIEPATDERLRAAGVVEVVRVAAEAACVGPGLRGAGAPQMRARRAAARAAFEVGISSTDIAWALGSSAKTARRLAAAPLDPPLLRAVRLRIAIEDAVAARSRSVA